MRKLKLMAATSAVALLTAGSAYAADPVEKEGMSLVVYGWVNYLAMYADSGDQGDFIVANAVSSGSRIGFKAKGQINDDLWTGATIEYGVQKTNSHQATFENNENGSGAPGIRHVYWWVKSAQLGRLAVGHTDTATNGTGEIDLSGTGVIDLNFTGWFNGAALTLGGNVGNPTVGSRIVGFDGNSRQDVVRYDTPSIAGFSLAASVTGDGDTDIAARYARAFGDIKIAAGVGYTKFSGNQNNGTSAYDELITASGGIKHASGLSLTLAYGERDDAAAGNDVESWNAKLGYSASLNEYGPTHFAVSYGETDSDAVADGETWGVHIVQDISHLGASFYAGYRNFDADDAADDVDVIMAGARVKF